MKYEVDIREIIDTKDGLFNEFGVFLKGTPFLVARSFPTKINAKTWVAIYNARYSNQLTLKEENDT
ncbi:MAG TPA: hypothetical protein VMY36_00040 [Patescibacteria group bacterium]|nr:hypothetical protein [Patescibacteria group bacterium]